MTNSDGGDIEFFYNCGGPEQSFSIGQYFDGPKNNLVMLDLNTKEEDENEGREYFDLNTFRFM